MRIKQQEYYKKLEIKNGEDVTNIQQLKFFYKNTVSCKNKSMVISHGQWDVINLADCLIELLQGGTGHSFRLKGMAIRLWVILYIIERVNCQFSASQAYASVETASCLWH